MPGCGSTCGIHGRRERERDLALEAAARAHPGLVWRAAPARRPDDDAALVVLGAALEALLPVRARVREGALSLLVGLHAPTLLEALDGEVDAVPEVDRETWLRVAISPHGPFVTIDEIDVERLGRAGVVATSRLGVIDRRLRDVVKGLQGALRAPPRRLVVLDAAFLLRAPPTTEPQRAYEDRFGAPPTLRALLFDALEEPPGTVRCAELVPSTAHERDAAAAAQPA